MHFRFYWFKHDSATLYGLMFFQTFCYLRSLPATSRSGLFRSACRPCAASAHLRNSIHWPPPRLPLPAGN